MVCEELLPRTIANYRHKETTLSQRCCTLWKSDGVVSTKASCAKAKTDARLGSFPFAAFPLPLASPVMTLERAAAPTYCLLHGTHIPFIQPSFHRQATCSRVVRGAPTFLAKSNYHAVYAKETRDGGHWMGRWVGVAVCC